MTHGCQAWASIQGSGVSLELYYGLLPLFSQVSSLNFYVSGTNKWVFGWTNKKDFDGPPNHFSGEF